MDMAILGSKEGVYTSCYVEVVSRRPRAQIKDLKGKKKNVNIPKGGPS